MIGLSTLVTVIPAILKAFNGKPDQIIDGVVVKATKGLKGSKTAGILTGAAGLKVAIMALPLDVETKLYILAGVAMVEFLAGIYVRVRTKGPV